MEVKWIKKSIENNGFWDRFWNGSGMPKGSQMQGPTPKLKFCLAGPLGQGIGGFGYLLTSNGVSPDLDAFLEGHLLSAQRNEQGLCGDNRGVQRSSNC